MVLRGLLSVPTDLQLLTEWWDATNPYILVSAVIFPVLVWAFRKLLARALFLPVVLVSDAFQLGIVDAEKQRILAAISSVSIAVSLFVSYYLLGLPGTISQLLAEIIRIILIVSVFRFLNEIAQCAIAQSTRNWASNNVASGNWLPQFVKLLLLVLMVVVLLKGWGIDLGPAMTGLGIAGAAVALAAQDLIRNLIAGVSIAGENRFKVGDWIHFNNGDQGIVQKMELRSTVIKKFDQSTLFVPNGELANATLTNFSNRRCRRLRWLISTTYPTTADTLEELCSRIFEFIDGNDRFMRNDEFNCFVRVFEFKPSSVDIIADCYVASNTWEGELLARHDLVLGIKRIFAELGVSHAFQTVTVLGDVDAENDPTDHLPR